MTYHQLMLPLLLDLCDCYHQLAWPSLLDLCDCYHQLMLPLLLDLCDCYHQLTLPSLLDFCDCYQLTLLLLFPPNREEGTIPYIPELPVSMENFINYNRSIFNVRGIHTAPAGLESTSLVFVYGIGEGWNWDCLSVYFFSFLLFLFLFFSQLCISSIVITVVHCFVLSD